MSTNRRSRDDLPEPEKRPGTEEVWEPKVFSSKSRSRAAVSRAAVTPLGVAVYALGFRVKGLGFRVYGLVFSV